LRGEKILQDIKTIMDIAHGWSNLKTDSARKTIRIAGTVSLTNIIMDSLVVRFQEKYPNVALEINEARRLETVELVRQGSVIGLFGAVPPKEIEQTRDLLQKANRSMEIMGRDDYVVFINHLHPLANQQAITCADLSRFTAALYPQDDHHFCYNEIFQHFSQEKAPHYASKQENILTLVGQNISIAAVFPQSAIHNPHIVKENLTALPVADFPMPGFNCLAYPSKQTLSPIEKELVDIIGRLCKEHSFPS
ncbi:MAG: substrate-binding domain-containing protein, partial [Mailhella sp.]